MKATSILLALVILLITAGCGNNSTNQAANSTNANADSVEAANTAANGAETDAAAETETEEPIVEEPAAAERSIVHAMGTTVLKDIPQRVVYLFAGMTDIGIALGVKPVGAVESADQKPWFKYLGDMSGVENLGEESQPNLEAIVALKPDLIIATKVRHEEIYSQLEAIAPTIVTNDLADWKVNLQLASEALGKVAEAAAIMADWNTKVADFQTKMGDKLATTEVSIIRFEKDGSAKFYIKGFPGLIVKELGLSLPKAQQVEAEGSGINLTSKEHIPQLDGDYIFDVTVQYNNQTNILQIQQEWQSHPLWNTLKAVKNNKYIPVDPITWNLGGGVIAAQTVLNDLYQHFDLN